VLNATHTQGGVLVRDTLEGRAVCGAVSESVCWQERSIASSDIAFEWPSTGRFWQLWNYVFQGELTSDHEGLNPPRAIG
jgi:hypothetical protein